MAVGTKTFRVVRVECSLTDRSVLPGNGLRDIVFEPPLVGIGASSSVVRAAFTNDGLGSFGIQLLGLLPDRKSVVVVPEETDTYSELLRNSNGFGGFGAFSHSPWGLAGDGAGDLFRRVGLSPFHA